MEKQQMAEDDRSAKKSSKKDKSKKSKKKDQNQKQFEITKEDL